MSIDKLSVLGGAAKYDICASTASVKSKISGSLLGSPVASGICHSFGPDGRCVSLLKVLMTNECQKDCGYCANRVQRDIPRTSFQAEELAGIFVELFRRNYVEGLFLSSGIRNGPRGSMEEMLKTAEILRKHHRFGGYIHLKVLPGSTPDLVEQAGKLADRVSLNLEVPNEESLLRISKTKNFRKELLAPLKSIAKTVSKTTGLTQTTQFVVGAAQESDQDVLSCVSNLYQQYHVKRSYFSAFQPIPGTPLEGLAPAPLKRENRLYQADFLLRLYRFKLEDLVFDPAGNMDLSLDPKLMYAVKNPTLFPIEINRGSQRELLLIPGIGPRSASRILAARRRHRFTTLEELKNIGVVLKRAAPFLTINGKKFADLKWLYNPQPQEFTQLSFW